MKNQTLTIGRIGQEVVLNTTGNVKAVNLSIAIDDGYINKEGNRVERTIWVRASAFGNTAELIVKHFIKGDQIAFEGKLTQNNWVDSHQQKRSDLEIQILRIEFLASITSKKEVQAEPTAPIEIIVAKTSKPIKGKK